MLVDPFCWSALAVDGETAQAVITVSTMLYVEWGRLGEIGDLYVLPEHRRKGLARCLVEQAKTWCRARGCDRPATEAAPVLCGAWRGDQPFSSGGTYPDSRGARGA